MVQGHRTHNILGLRGAWWVNDLPHKNVNVNVDLHEGQPDCQLLHNKQTRHHNIVTMFGMNGEDWLARNCMGNQTLTMVLVWCSCWW